VIYGDREINTRLSKKVSESKGYGHGQYSSLLPTAPPSDLVRAHGGSAVQAFPQAATKQYITFAVAMA